MAGLLYKDFAVIKGKLICLFLGLICALLLLVQFMLPQDEAAEISYLCIGVVFLIIILMYVYALTNLEKGILSAEAGKRQRQYYLSTPVTKTEYVRSKYVFMFLAFCIIYFAALLMLVICRVGCREQVVNGMLKNMYNMLPLAAGAFLAVPALEMPFFIVCGVQKGNLIKTGMMIVLFFLLMIFMMFGDLTVLDRLGLDVLMEYLGKNKGLFKSLKIIVPLVSCMLYYLSYRISRRLFVKKEWDED